MAETSALDQWTTVFDADRFRHALNSARFDLLRPRANQRHAWRRTGRCRFSTERGVARQYTMKDESQHDRRENVAPEHAPDAERDMAGVATG